MSMKSTVGPLPLPGVKNEEIQAIRYVATGAEIPVSTSWVHSDYPTMAFADLGEDPVLPDGVVYSHRCDSEKVEGKNRI